MEWIGTDGDLGGAGTVAGVDFETTGLDPWGGDRIVQVGVVLYDGPFIVDHWSTMCNPEGRKQHPGAADTNGFTDEELADAPNVFEDEAADRLAEMTEGRLVIAHRLTFDLSFWAAEMERIGATPPRRHGMCSKVLSAAAGMRGNLFSIAEQAGITPTGQAHEALADAKACVQIAKRSAWMLGGYDQALDAGRDVVSDRNGMKYITPVRDHQDIYRNVLLNGNTSRD